MVRIVPFKAFRPPSEMAQEVAAPPYDVINSIEARAMYNMNPKSFLRVNKPEVDLPEEISQYDVQVYDMGRRNLLEFIEKGYLVQDDVPCYYIYSQTMGTHTQYGVCAGVYVEDYAMGIIKRHEKTQVKKENDRTRLTYVQNANVGPVFLMYRDNATIDQIVTSLIADPPDTHITTDDGIQHTVWAVKNPQMVFDLRRAFKSVPCLYIADGHHRSASAFRVGEMRIKEAIARGETISGAEPFNHFLAVLFPASQLKIFDYNRIVKDLNGFSIEQFLERVRVCFEIVQVEEGTDPRPCTKRQFGMCLGPNGTWYSLTAKEGTYETEDPVNSLDVQVLYDNLLSSILNIGNPRTDERIQYVGGIRGMAELKQRVTAGANPWAVSFALFPISVEEVMDIADADQLMPPKATWFEPKLRSGLLVRSLDDSS